MRLSIVEEKILADIYEEILNEMMSADVLGTGDGSYGSSGEGHGGDVGNSDWYAQGDTRNPFKGGKKIQTRKGVITPKKKVRKKKKKSSEFFL